MKKHKISVKFTIEFVVVPIWKKMVLSSFQNWAYLYFFQIDLTKQYVILRKWIEFIIDESIIEQCRFTTNLYEKYSTVFFYRGL